MGKVSALRGGLACRPMIQALQERRRLSLAEWRQHVGLVH